MESKVWLVGGSIPERDGDLLFNTSSVYSPEGRFLGKYRKVTIVTLFSLTNPMIIIDASL